MINCDKHNDCTCREMKEIDIQPVWRCLSSNIYGFFVWEVLQVMGTVEPDIHSAHFTPTRDGGYIYINCYHYWTYEKAYKAFTEDDRYQDITCIS